MDKLDSRFESEAHLTEVYRTRLGALLQAGQNDADAGLAAFILVCANAYFDRQMLAGLKDELDSTCQRLRAHYASLLAQGRMTDERLAEDLLVFLKINLLGLNQLQVAEHRQVAWWRVQFNHVRSFRPQRNAARPVASLEAPFNEQVFHYTRELCRREGFWTGSLAGRRTHLLYNKYPFARLHALVIPEPEKHSPQCLTQAHHCWAWQATESLAERLPGFGMGYNSLGTFASVNHLHFQSFIEPRGMPVTWPIWQHNGGSEGYPTACTVFTRCEDAWAWIAALHRQDTTAYNLLYTPGKLYCFERQRQGLYKHASWTSGFAWYEVAGNLIIFNREDYTAITFEKIQKEFKKLAVSCQLDVKSSL